MATEQQPQAEPQSAPEPSDLDIAMAAIDGKPEPTAEPAPADPKPAEPPAQAAPKPAEPPEGDKSPGTDAGKAEPSQWQQAIETERQRLETQRREKDMVSLADLRSRAKEDPQKVADDLGISLDALLAAMAGPDQTPQETDTDKAELTAALKRVDALEAAEKARQEASQTQSRQEQYNSQLEAITGMVGDRELCKTFSDRAVPLAFQTAVEICRQANITPNPQIIPAIYNAALDSVEQHLETEESERIEKARTTQKLGKLFGVQPQRPATAQSAATEPQPTIGDVTGNTSAPPELSDEEIFLQGVDDGRKAEGRAPFGE